MTAYSIASAKFLPLFFTSQCTTIFATDMVVAHYKPIWITYLLTY